MIKVSSLMIKKLGFTLIELLVVIAVVGILTAIGLVVYKGIKEKTNYTKIVADMDAFYNSAMIYEKTKGFFPVDQNPGVSPDLVPETMQAWPVSPCAPDVVYDWDSWLDHNAVDTDGKKWTPIIRVSLRRINNDQGVNDDTTLFYQCIQPNNQGKCTCEDVTFPGDSYCKSLGGSVKNLLTLSLSCDDLKSTAKFPSLP